MPSKYNKGDKVHDWTIIHKLYGTNKYLIECKCGEQFERDCTQIESIRCCRKCSRVQIHPGDRFGCSVVLEELPRAKWERMFRVQCDCGREHTLGFKTLKSRTACNGAGNVQKKSQIAKLLERYPNAPMGIRDSKCYELWVWLRREVHAELCDRWNTFVDFFEDFAELMGGDPYEYISPRIGWVYYTFERIDKNGIWEKSNVTARKFFSERAYSRNTYAYWRLLGNRGLLEEDLKDDYILFVNTFGEKEPGYALKRRDKRRLHSRRNSYWVKSRKVKRDRTPDTG